MKVKYSGVVKMPFDLPWLELPIEFKDIQRKLELVSESDSSLDPGFFKIQRNS